MKKVLSNVSKTLNYLDDEDKLRVIPLLYVYYKITEKTELDLQEIRKNEKLSFLEKTLKQTVDSTPLNKALEQVSEIRETEDTVSDIYTVLSNTLKDISDKGEYYTPNSVVDMMIDLAEVTLEDISEVYDPTCGTGAILLNAYKKIDNINIYGQEVNKDTCNLAQLNMEINNIPSKHVDIRQGCTLCNPQYSSEVFNLIIANPPYSLHKPADYDLNHDPVCRKYGGVTREKNMDYVFIQHMLDKLSDDGVILTVEPIGVLLDRTPIENKIKENLIIEHNCIDAIIELPKHIFPNTNITTAVIVFKKDRETEDILFITLKNSMISSDTTRKVIETYKERSSVKNFSYNASKEDIDNKEYNLNPSFYIKFEEEEYNMDDLISKYKEITAKKNEKIIEINQLLESLGVDYKL